MKHASPAVVCLAVLSAATARANPADLFGFGTRTPALGNAGVASSDPLGAPIYNAAAGAFGDALALELGYSYAKLDLSINDRDANLLNPHGTWAALAVPFGLGSVRIGYTFALYVPDHFMLRLHTVPATEQQLVMWDNSPHRIVFGTALAARFAELVAVGVGVTGLGDAQGDVNLELGSRPGRTVADASVDTRLPTRFAPIAGVLVTPNDWLRLGARYADELALHVDLDAFAETSVQGTSLDGTTLVRTRGLDYFTPRQVAAGAAVERGQWTFTAELVYRQWSAITSVAYDVELIVDLGVDTPVSSFEAPDPGWHDVVEPHVGVERRFDAGRDRMLTGRVGYWFAPSPVPEQTGLTNYGDADRHVLCAGAGFEFEDLGIPLGVDLAFLAQLLERTENRKRGLLEPGGDFTVSGQVYWLSAGVRARF